MLLFILVLISGNLAEALKNDCTRDLAPYRITAGLQPDPKFTIVTNRIDVENWKTAKYAKMARKIVNYRNDFPQEYLPFSDLEKDDRRIVKLIWKMSWNSKVPRNLKNPETCKRFFEVGIVQIKTAGREKYEKIVTANKASDVPRSMVFDAIKEMLRENSIAGSSLDSVLFYHTHPPAILTPSGPLLSSSDFMQQRALKDDLLAIGIDVPVHVFSTSNVGDGMVTFHASVP